MKFSVYEFAVLASCLMSLTISVVPFSHLIASAFFKACFWVLGLIHVVFCLYFNEWMFQGMNTLVNSTLSHCDLT